MLDCTILFNNCLSTIDKNNAIHKQKSNPYLSRLCKIVIIYCNFFAFEPLFEIKYIAVASHLDTVTKSPMKMRAKNTLKMLPAS